MVELLVADSAPAYPDLSGLFPAANRMQRALFDLLGIGASGAADTRPWLRHGAWPEEAFPLRRDFDPATLPPNALADYDFVRVEGDGVHEIPVGPIHAGIIEPGHFRFSIVGEKVLRLEERLGYVHKGIDKRFEVFTVAEGYRLAGRVSGDSTVAFAWAYAQAAESLLGVVPPPRARWIARAAARARARGQPPGRPRRARQRRRARLRARAVHAPEGGLAARERRGVRPSPAHGPRRARRRGRAASTPRRPSAWSRARTRSRPRCASCARIFDEHAGLQDRFLTTGRVTPDLARKLGLTGLAGRASGQAFDLRVDFPAVPYGELARAQGRLLRGRRGGARERALRRAARIAAARARHRDGRRRTASCASSFRSRARRPSAWAGWRAGAASAFVALEAGEGGMIRRCHAHDPSWQNWPLIEHAVIGNIVPDFPLINKSFNLSYSGQDC